MVLEKRESIIGEKPVGAVYYARTEDQARAFRMLKRDLPSENPLCWDIATTPEEEKPCNT